MAATSTKRLSSLVVIGGWLGCKRKHLEAYERLYNSLGFDVLSVVASPLCVIDATLNRQGIPGDERDYPSSEQWPDSANENDDPSSSDEITEMQALAWDVLGTIHNSQAYIFVYHSFSNGGCFLWEGMCQIMLSSNAARDRKISSALDNLRGRCRGVVFDSCPAWFGSKQGSSSELWQALRHCSEGEKRRVEEVYGDRLKIVSKAMVNRNLEYFENLATFQIDIPQLYLYSKNDDLSKHEHISEMIATRGSRQKHSVLKQAWEDSIHCGHLRKHNEDYKEAVKAFIQQLDTSYHAGL